MNKLGKLALLLLCLCVGACQSGSTEVIDLNHRAARNLIRMAGTEISPARNMIAASFADINDLTESSPFGRIASQQLVSAFTRQGYRFVDLLLRDSVYVSENQGEFLLSREVNEIGKEHDAAVVLVGTYATSQSMIFVTAKLIRSADGVILASHDYAIPMSGAMRGLVQSRR